MPTSQPVNDTVQLELLRRTAQGDVQAFRELYTQTRKQVYTYLYRMLTVRAIADIALVETYLQAAKSAAKFNGSLGRCQCGRQIGVLLVSQNPR